MSEALQVAREVLAGDDVWLVGGAVRDQLLGRDTDDVDVAVRGEPRPYARRLARAARGTAFELSGAFGAWRVVGPHHAWHVDLVTLRDDDIVADLSQRDFTINAMAAPLDGGELVDPHGGRDDLARRVVRMVSARSLVEDPLRSLRAIRFVVELGLELDPATGTAVAENAPGIRRVAFERVFAELKRVISAEAVRRGLELMDAYGLTPIVLPELTALRGIEQSHFHHLDVYDHTLAVLDTVAQLQREPAAFGLDDEVRTLLAEPLSDELTRGQAMRWAALLHDAAKPQTRDVLANGRVTFMGHDAAGAKLARDVLARMRSSARLRDYVAAIVAHHLDAGFLVHQRPLDRRTVWRYLRATQPYSADITIFTVADRLATRGRNAEGAIAAHLEVARELLAAARAEDAAGPRKPLLRGDELVREAGVPAGPRLGQILAQLEEDRFAGVIATREEALARARSGSVTARGEGAPAEGGLEDRAIAIRFGGAGMEDRLAAIINAAYHHGEASIWQPGWQRITTESVAELVAQGEIAIAWQDGKPVGCVRIRRLEDGAGMFGMLSVDPAAHGSGLGRALIAFAEATYPDADQMELELLIPRGAPHPSKVRLHEWYSRLGYVQIGRRDFDEPLLAAPADLWVYRKNLRATPATEAPERAPT